MEAGAGALAVVGAEALVAVWAAEAGVRLGVLLRVDGRACWRFLDGWEEA